MRPKVWIIPCSGIGKSYGTVAREGAYIITEELRPGTTRLMPLSLLVLDDGDARDEVARAQNITIDGCKLACAAKVVAASGGRTTRNIFVQEVHRRHRDLKPAGIADLNENGKKLARAVADKVSEVLDDTGREVERA